MLDARSGSRIAEAAPAWVLGSGWGKASFALQFFAKVLAGARQTSFNKRNAHVRVDGTKRIVGDVDLRQRCGTEEGRLPDVRFPYQSNAHLEHAPLVGFTPLLEQPRCRGRA